MISQLRRRTTANDGNQILTPVGVILDYEDPKCLTHFSEPPIFRTSRMLVNAICGTVNYRLSFVSISGKELLYRNGYVKMSAEIGMVQLHETNGMVWDVLIDEFEGLNTHLHSQSKQIGMPIQVPLVPIRKGESLVWDYSRLVCDTKRCSASRVVQEWIGFLALIHASSTRFIIRTIKDKNFSKPMAKGHTNEVLNPSLPQQTPVFWIYYSSPKPLSLETFLQEILTTTDWSEHLSRQLERYSPRHEGFYRAALLENDGITSISFDYGEDSLFEVELKRIPPISNALPNEMERTTLMYFLQPVSFDVKSMPGGKQFLGFSTSCKYVPLSVLPGVERRQIINYGVVRTELDELWSKAWHKKYATSQSGSFSIRQELVSKGCENFQHLFRFDNE